MPSHLILVRHSAVQVDTAVSGPLWQLSVDGRSRCHTLAPKIQPLALPGAFVVSLPEMRLVTAV